MRRPACAAWSLLAVAGRLLRSGWSALFALVPDPPAWTAAAATAATMTTFLLLTIPRAGIRAVGGDQLFRIIRLLIRSDEALPVAAVITGTLVATAIGVLRFAATLTQLVVLLVRVMLLLAGILVLAHLAVAVTALLVVAGMLRLVAAMTVAGECRREALAHILHVDVGHRDFAAADSRPLAFVLRCDDSIVMVGMLQEVLSSHTVSGGAGIARELEVLLEDLKGIAADPNIGSAAVETMCLALPTTAVATATMRAAMGFARAATAAPSILIIRSHASITSHCCGPGFAPRAISPRRISSSGKTVKRARSSSGALAPGDRHSVVGGRIRGVGQPAAVVRMFTPEPKRP